MIIVVYSTFNNISAISWLSVLLVGKTRVPGESNRPVAIHRQRFIHYTYKDEIQMKTSY